MAEKTTTLPIYVSLRQAAESLAVSDRTIRRLIAEGRLDAYRYGKRAIRIKLADLETLLQQIPAAG